MSDRARRDIGRFTILPEWIVRRGLSARAVRLYVELGFFADYETGECWPSQATLAEAMGCSVDTVQRALGELQAEGAVEVTRRHDDTGGQRSNLYTLSTVDPKGPPPQPRGTPGRTDAVDPHRTDAALNKNHDERDALSRRKAVDAQERQRRRQQAYAERLDSEQPASRNHAAEALARLREGRPVEDVKGP